MKPQDILRSAYEALINTHPELAEHVKTSFLDAVPTIMLLWDNNPEEITAYVVPVDHAIADVIRDSANLYFNSDDIEDDHPINALNEWLATDDAKAMKVVLPYIGDVGETVLCGLMM